MHARLASLAVAALAVLAAHEFALLAVPGPGPCSPRTLHSPFLAACARRQAALAAAFNFASHTTWHVGLLTLHGSRGKSDLKCGYLLKPTSAFVLSARLITALGPQDAGVTQPTRRNVVNLRP